MPIKRPESRFVNNARCQRTSSPSMVLLKSPEADLVLWFFCPKVSPEISSPAPPPPQSLSPPTQGPALAAVSTQTDPYLTIPKPLSGPSRQTTPLPLSPEGPCTSQQKVKKRLILLSFPLPSQARHDCRALTLECQHPPWDAAQLWA